MCFLLLLFRAQEIPVGVPGHKSFEQYSGRFPTGKNLNIADSASLRYGGSMGSVWDGWMDGCYTDEQSLWGGAR